jgi:hypothetical protein
MTTLGAMTAVVVVAAAAAAVVPPSPPGSGGYHDLPCQLRDLVDHNWTFIAPPAFRGGVWDKQHECIYQFKACGVNCFEFASPPQCLSDHAAKLSSATGTLDDAVVGGAPQVVSLRYGDGQPNCSALPGQQCRTPGGQNVSCPCQESDVCGCPGATKTCTPCHTCQRCSEGSSSSRQGVRKVGWMSARCSLIDLEDGGMYVRGNPGGACPCQLAMPPPRASSYCVLLM